MAIDARKNFAKGTVSTGYDAAAVSIALTTGHGARFPAAPFNATWWNSTDYPNPADDPNREIVRVTAIVGDTLTITRAQESTSASTKNTADKTYLFAQTITAKMIDDIETDLAAKETPTGAQAKADAAQSAAIAAAASDATTKANAAQAAAVQRANHTGTQAISTVTGLQTALDGKASSSHTHSLSAITDAGTAAALNVPASGDAASGEVVKGNDSRLSDARTPTTHSHAISDVTGLQTALDGKAASSHSHAISDVTGLQTALDGKATTSTKLDDFAAPDDNTDLDATTGRHGLMPKADKVKVDALHTPTWGTLTSSSGAASLALTAAKKHLTMTMTENTVITVSDFAQGREAWLDITGDSVLRTIEIAPASGSLSWREGELVEIPANKRVTVELKCPSSTGTDCVAVYAEET